MDRKLQNLLFEKYPKIFRQKDLTPQETCMCWGISCGDGWFDIIDKLCYQIQSYVDDTGVSQVEAAQVKSKWGGLRFYIDNGNSYVYGLIAMAESISRSTKELTDKEMLYEEKVNDWSTTSQGELHLDSAINGIEEEYEEEICLYTTYGGD